MTKVKRMTLLILMPMSWLVSKSGGPHGHADLGVVDELGQHHYQRHHQEWRNHRTILVEVPAMVI